MKSLVTYNVPAPLMSEKLVTKLSDQEYRHAYMAEGVRAWISRQVRALREQRDWSQGDLARESGKKQSAISRIEDPDYGQLTLQTLFDLAEAYDLPLLVQFVEWQDWLYRMEDVSTEALRKDGFNGENIAALGRQYQTSIESLTTIYDGTLSATTTVSARTFVTRGYDWDMGEIQGFQPNEESSDQDAIKQLIAQNVPAIFGLTGHG